MHLDLWLLLSAPAGAWSLTGTDWSWQSHPVEDPFLLDLDSFPDEVDPTEVDAALRGAMESWTGLGLDMSLAPGAETTGATLAADGDFSILHAAYDGMDTVLAFTGAWVWDAEGAGFDCDVVFLDYNDYGDIVWDASPDGPASGAYDVEAVALHELGHCLGFGHSDDSGAVMYAYYAGLRALTTDDEAAATATFGAGCLDGDGDGVTDCDGDCDDENALISPAVEELCDGIDANCNGAIDESEGAVVALYKDGTEQDTSWVSAGNAFRVDAPTTLRSLRQQMSVAEGARLVWTVYRSEDEGASWTLVRELRSEGTLESWQQSPDLDLPLSEGLVYEASLGVLGEQGLSYTRRPDLESQGPITPLGYVVSRALGDQPSTISSVWLVNQELTFTAVSDPDGDGQTGLCGDCEPEDATVYEGAEELCDGLDQSCDGVADDGLTDGDADGAPDCMDPCPADPLDDQDGDGLCADQDPCPEDPLDACDDPPPVDTADTGPGDTGTVDTDVTPGESGNVDETKSSRACGCVGAAGPPGALLLIPALLLAARRRR